MGNHCERKNETEDSELRLISNYKTEFDVAIAMIESGETEQIIIDAENW